MTSKCFIRSNQCQNLILVSKILTIKPQNIPFYIFGINSINNRFTLYQVNIDGSASGVKSVHPAFAFSSAVYIFKNSPLSPTQNQLNNLQSTPLNPTLNRNRLCQNPKSKITGLERSPWKFIYLRRPEFLSQLPK